MGQGGLTEAKGFVAELRCLRLILADARLAAPGAGRQAESAERGRQMVLHPPDRGGDLPAQAEGAPPGVAPPETPAQTIPARHQGPRPAHRPKSGADKMNLAKPVTLTDGSSCQIVTATHYRRGLQKRRCYRIEETGGLVRLSKASLAGPEFIGSAKGQASPVLAEFFAGLGS
jgi:hypothetical protein